jgi:hypothetical protein
MYILLGVHEAEADRRIQVELVNILKPKAMRICNKHVGYVVKSDRMQIFTDLFVDLEMDKKAVFLYD